MADINITFIPTNSTATQPRIPESVLQIWFGVTTSITIFGSILFLLLLVSITAAKTLRTGSGFLIVHLLLVECITVSICYQITNTVTFTVLSRKPSTWINSIDCALVQFFMTTFQHTGNWSSFFLAINRYVAIFHPTKYRHWTSKWSLLSMISLSWLISLSCNLPLYFGIGGNIGRTSSGDCGLLNFRKLDYPFRAAFGYYIPLITSAVIYFTLLIRTTLRRHFTVMTIIPTARELNRTHRRLVITKMLFASSIFYSICYFPAPVMVTFFPDYVFRNRDVFLYIRSMVVCGYAANPVICFLMNKDYREAATRLFRRQQHRLSSKNSVSHNERSGTLNNRPSNERN